MRSCYRTWWFLDAGGSLASVGRLWRLHVPPITKWNCARPDPQARPPVYESQEHARSRHRRRNCTTAWAQQHDGTEIVRPRRTRGAATLSIKKHSWTRLVSVRHAAISRKYRHHSHNLLPVILMPSGTSAKIEGCVGKGYDGFIRHFSVFRRIQRVENGLFCSPNPLFFSSLCPRRFVLFVCFVFLLLFGEICEQAVRFPTPSIVFCRRTNETTNKEKHEWRKRGKQKNKGKKTACRMDVCLCERIVFVDYDDGCFELVIVLEMMN